MLLFFPFWAPPRHKDDEVSDKSILALKCSVLIAHVFSIVSKPFARIPKQNPFSLLEWFSFCEICCPVAQVFWFKRRSWLHGGGRCKITRSEGEELTLSAGQRPGRHGHFGSWTPGLSLFNGSLVLKIGGLSLS